MPSIWARLKFCGVVRNSASQEFELVQVRVEKIAGNLEDAAS